MIWIAFTLAAALAQTFRNAVQSALAPKLGRMGATQTRFVFGWPFALAALGALAHFVPIPRPGPATLGWAAAAGFTQVLATLFMLSAMQRRDFAVGTAYIKTEPVTVALVSLLALGERPSGATLAAIALAVAGVV
ncbi:MAG: EamA family transporter, partial [Hyphomicrobiales bacterium]|nr:EamA family transporter [Hyphomicrobiales bacterium]